MNWERGYWGEPPPPIYPQPGFFETTTAAIDHWPEGETKIITHEEIERLLALPKFDWHEALVRSDNAWATRKGKGWGEVAGVYHCLRIKPRTTRAPVHLRSLCGDYEVGYGAPLLFSAAGLDRCGDCLHREIAMRV